MSRTQWLLRRSSTASGRVVDAPRRGYAFPLDTFVVDPRAYARVTGDAAFRDLRGGRVLLSEASARLRRLKAGDRITLTGGRRVVVAGVVPDGVARGAELVAEHGRRPARRSAARPPSSSRRATRRRWRTPSRTTR